MDVGFRLDHPAQGLRKLLREGTRGSEAKAIFKAVLAVSPDNPNARQGMALP